MNDIITSAINGRNFPLFPPFLLFGSALNSKYFYFILDLYDLKKFLNKKKFNYVQLNIISFDFQKPRRMNEVKAAEAKAVVVKGRVETRNRICPSLLRRCLAYLPKIALTQSAALRRAVEILRWNRLERLILFPTYSRKMLT